MELLEAREGLQGSRTINPLMHTEFQLSNVPTIVQSLIKDR